MWRPERATRAHLYSSCSSTRASECWHVKAVPSISSRMAVVAAMSDGLLQNHQLPAHTRGEWPGQQVQAQQI